MSFRAQKKNTCEVSINETIDIDREGNPLTYIDINRTEDTIADDLDEKQKIIRMIRFIREQLNDRERKIMIMRYGLNDAPPVTQRETAEALGISRSYVSRIEKSALDKIREYMTSGAVGKEKSRNKM